MYKLSELKSSKWAHLAILIMLAYGTFLRVYPINKQPYWMDEGYTINAVLAYKADEIEGFSAVLDSGQHYECFLYCYPTAILSATFGDEPFVYRVLAIFAGISLIFAIYTTSRHLYTKKIALLASFFTIFAYFQIAWSTQARWYTLVALLFWVSINLILSASIAKNARYKILYIVAAIITASLAVFGHTLALLVFPALILSWFNTHHNYKQIFSRKKELFLFILLVCAAGLFFIKEIYYLLAGLSLHFGLPYYISFILREYWGLLPFIIFAIVTARRTEWLLLTIFLLYLIPLSTLTSIIHYRYLFYVTPALYILAAIGVFRVGDVLKSSYQVPSYMTVFIAIFLFFVSPTGTLLPQDRYWLESDDPATLNVRPGYAYTPQPDWNAAYAYIADNKETGDITISSHPHFTKIFLHEPGYWISYDYLGMDNRTQYRTADDREFYVGAQILDDLDAIKALTETHHGYIIYDYMAADGRITPEILDYVETNFEPVFQKTDNSYSQIWVYKF